MSALMHAGLSHTVREAESTVLIDHYRRQMVMVSPQDLRVAELIIK